MQASSCTSTHFIMQSKQIKPNRHIGTSGKSVESYKGFCDSNKRKKIDTTDWTCRPVGEPRGKLSNCVFTRARPNRRIHKSGGSDAISPKRASNHRYGPGRNSVASGAIGRQHLVPRRFASAHRFTDSSSGWTQHTDDWWVAVVV